ncbi:type-1 angiotensin II receptor-associated protein isoform X3 [Camelus dromedarius]|uniref:type-1 angiotensin II receptor-associated protein isoform X3 n=1 Tax=Camelus dromedarius TaxID=9838 RepID=UPI00311976A4
MPGYLLNHNSLLRLLQMSKLRLRSGDPPGSLAADNLGLHRVLRPLRLGQLYHPGLGRVGRCAAGLRGRHKYGELRRQRFLGGLVVTVFLDVIHISIFYPRAGLSDTVRFSAGMAILSLLLKPFSCCLVYHMYRERGGFLGPSQDRSAYQTIASPEVPADPESRGSIPQGY